MNKLKQQIISFLSIPDKSDDFQILNELVDHLCKKTSANNDLKEAQEDSINIMKCIKTRTNLYDAYINGQTEIHLCRIMSDHVNAMQNQFMQSGDLTGEIDGCFQTIAEYLFKNNVKQISSDALKGIFGNNDALVKYILQTCPFMKENAQGVFDFKYKTLADHIIATTYCKREIIKKTF